MSSSRRVARRPKLAKVPSFGKSVRDSSPIPHDCKKQAENPRNSSEKLEKVTIRQKISKIHAYCARAAASQQQPPSSSLSAATSQQQPPSSSFLAAAFAASQHQLHGRRTQKPQGCRRTLSQLRSPAVAHGNPHSSSTAVALQPHSSSSTAASPQQQPSSSGFNRSSKAAVLQQRPRRCHLQNLENPDFHCVFTFLFLVLRSTPGTANCLRAIFKNPSKLVFF